MYFTFKSKNTHISKLSMDQWVISENGHDSTIWPIRSADTQSDQSDQLIHNLTNQISWYTIWPIRSADTQSEQSDQLIHNLTNQMVPYLNWPIKMASTQQLIQCEPWRQLIQCEPWRQLIQCEPWRHSPMSMTGRSMSATCLISAPLCDKTHWDWFTPGKRSTTVYLWKSVPWIVGFLGQWSSLSSTPSPSVSPSHTSPILFPATETIANLNTVGPRFYGHFSITATWLLRSQ